MWENTIALIAVAVPLVLAWIYRLPRRTLRLAKEVEILAGLEPGTEAHAKFAAHVERLVAREIDDNETAFQLYDLYTWTGLCAYAVGLLMVGRHLIAGRHLGGAGWVLFAFAIALLILLGIVAVMKVSNVLAQVSRLLARGFHAAVRFGSRLVAARAKDVHVTEVKASVKRNPSPRQQVSKPTQGSPKAPATDPAATP